MHFAIRFLTEYRYEAPVSDNLNALRVMPATTRTQRVDDFGVRVDPETRLHQHLDYFGPTVSEFGISRPHEQLSIDVHSAAGMIRGTRSSGNGRSRIGPSASGPAASNVMPCCMKIASRRRPAAASWSGPSACSALTSVWAYARGVPPASTISS